MSYYETKSDVMSATLKDKIDRISFSHQIILHLSLIIILNKTLCQTLVHQERHI